ncbi:hypothetical protein DFH11DRAFT_515324 [Phellopilus nigrolimitatus]|nr:hypothetical protein DFH11DRAFT_515324 [Phellopilus nigrolimitatus]
MQDSVQQSVSEVAREARTLAQSLKEAFKKNEALDKDVEFRRKNLRKQHLKLLLLYPNSKEAKDAETHIWMQTSYQFIAAYKQRITTLDRKLFSPAAQTQKSLSRHEHGGGGHVEYRKVLQRFRQFLAEEEKFYVQLLIRFRMQFDLTEASPALVKVEILSASSEDSPQPDSGRNIFPERRDTPPETSHERVVRLAMFSKLLVCLGDIARYREQYNDGGGRPRAGHEEGSPKKPSRGGKRAGQETLVRPRNYSRAQTIYEQACLLVPDDGNASHQLAILSSYQKDSFGSLLHYYRALCVRQPYDTASENLNTVLKKALDQFRAAKRSSKSAPGDGRLVPKLRVDRFKEWVVVLHGLWFLDSDESAARATKHARNVIAEFKSLISERILPSGTVSEIIVLAIGALWKLRMIRDAHIRTDRKAVEPLMASHILDLSRTLLVMGSHELAEKPENVQDKDDLAQHITAAFRRTLPAARIASKWLRSNFSYVETAMSSGTTSPSFLEAIKDFWKAYTSFSTSLSEAFPITRLPSLKNPLEEDVDMTGFSPIKKSMFKRSAPTENGLALGQDKVHPNEEYLMRISDLLEDAHQMVKFEKSPISFNNNRFLFAEEDISSTGTADLLSPANVSSDAGDRHPDPQQIICDSDDDNATQTSRTDDDVIREAFNEALGDRGTVGSGVDDDDEDDQIVWSPPKPQLSPLPNVHHPLQGSPQAFMPVQLGVNMSPSRQLPPSGSSTSTTAQDLLNNVLGVSRTNSDLTHHAVSSAPQASLLFGSGSLNAPTKSIWSSNGSDLGAVGVGGYASTQHAQHLAPGHGRTQSLSQQWSSSSLSIGQGSNSISLSSAPPASLSMGPLIGNQNCQHLIHQSSSMHSFQVPQVVYDSQFSRAPVPPVHLQDTRPQVYAGQPECPPFMLYDSHDTSVNTSIAPHATSVQRTTWNT